MWEKAKNHFENVVDEELSQIQLEEIDERHPKNGNDGYWLQKKELA